MIIYYKTNPSRLMLSGFVLAILTGTFGLLMPPCTTAGHISVIDAFFTATSAVCVTGLTVLDTGSDFTLVGQVAILTMFQLGGIGIVFFSVLFAMVFMGRAGIGQKSMFSALMTPHAALDAWGVFRTIVSFTLAVELLGALFLFVPMLTVTDGDLMQAVFYSLFHSVSGFCNAGFSLMSTSFEGLRSDYLATTTLMVLIIMGGLGFFVIDDVMQYIRTKQKHRITVHSKIVILTSLVLVLGGAVLIFVFEKYNTLAQDGFTLSIMDSLFMSVTARTAGFNTLRVSELANPTIFAIMILMFIGASPGSTGGGVKTSTLGVIWALIISRYKGQDHVFAFRRTIPEETISQAQAILATSMALVMVVTMCILVSEIRQGTGVLMERYYFVSSFFEVISAFGTVGLSMGITPQLTVLNKAFISLTMFVGRLGPLTVLMALKRRTQAANYVYAEENVLVG
jgi:trk system potassium uptake protein TrkH